MSDDAHRGVKGFGRAGILTVGAILGAFALGIWVRPGFDAVGEYFVPERHLHCLTQASSICVGSPFSNRAIDLADGIGVTFLVCMNEPVEARRDNKAMGLDWDDLFFPEFVTKPCLTNSYDIHLSDRVADIRVEVRNGSIRDIVRGPLHVVDL